MLRVPLPCASILCPCPGSDLGCWTSRAYHGARDRTGAVEAQTMGEGEPVRAVPTAQLFQVTATLFVRVLAAKNTFWKLLRNQKCFWKIVFSSSEFFHSDPWNSDLGLVWRRVSYTGAITGSPRKNSIHIMESWNELSMVEFGLLRIAWDRRDRTSFKMVTLDRMWYMF